MSDISQLKTKLSQINAINTAVAVMDWDQQCYMPEGGAEARSEHVGHLSELSHSLFTSQETQRLVEDAKKSVEPGSLDADYVRIVARNLEKDTKIPADLVARKARLSTIGHEKWVKARAANDFAGFAPTLEQMFDIAREEAECLGYKDHIYDALTDLYEEGATKAYWDGMFDQIREPLTQLVADIKSSNNQPDDSFLTGNFDKAKQEEFSHLLMDKIGFDSHRGRLDTAPHPFCTNFSVGDVRLTTRFQDFLPSAIFGTLHEAGHGMYEQGSPMEWDMTPLAGGVSLGFHESQSRTWENIVGRSEAFWSYFYGDLQAAFPQLKTVDLPEFYRAVNKAEPSLIRVEADEVTYNLHILIRFELECGLLSGQIKVKDLPGEWNARYEKYLGITPPSDKDGCLQDVHWSGALIGYFPTYSMGNILSYQIWGELKKSLPNVDDLMAKGEFAPILGWLIENLYQYGSRIKPQDLLKQITGGGLDAKPYLEGISAKYRKIYGI